MLSGGRGKAGVFIVEVLPGEGCTAAEGCSASLEGLMQRRRASVRSGCAILAPSLPTHTRARVLRAAFLAGG